MSAGDAGKILNELTGKRIGVTRITVSWQQFELLSG